MLIQKYTFIYLSFCRKSEWNTEWFRADDDSPHSEALIRNKFNVNSLHSSSVISSHQLPMSRVKLYHQPENTTVRFLSVFMTETKECVSQPGLKSPLHSSYMIPADPKWLIQSVSHSVLLRCSLMSGWSQCTKDTKSNFTIKRLSIQNTKSFEDLSLVSVMLHVVKMFKALSNEIPDWCRRYTHIMNVQSGRERTRDAPSIPECDMIPIS